MSIPTVLQVGDPRLRTVCTPVAEIQDPTFQAACVRLHKALAHFRANHGFGRAIAAPQIGVAKRFIAMHLDDAPFTVINPTISWRSEETMTLWDDCMSFPWLLVRVRRHRSISVRFWDQNGTPHEWVQMDTARSELFQHEMDHLDGVLALDLALDKHATVSREVFETDPEPFKKQVDYGGVYA